MRIYLSSYRLGHRSHVLRGAGGQALIVMNALDEFPHRLRNWERESGDLGALGYSCQELDLREYWHCEAGQLEARLEEADLLWVVGGNAFVLARAATAAGLGKALTESAQLTYAGYSAGACLASVDLRGIELMDDPATLPEGYHAGISADSLNLIGTRVIPHAGEQDAEAAASCLRAEGLEFVELKDGEDLLLGF
ncbi:Type 1 glutamine amidotransferase-like domain-containing protein [Nesterenkonia ebinurensis]|uniref:Type 1 glutamine amidotransferase-like domain-containing protein n=1 Tax=Nesterenkonia ebinurensis TaxID=2608252 RepID=UPI00123DA010|nr:Type 1 glutamine amidotransferase-like domain-containing protein [Nesterenkonia ebinurensis]